MNSFSFLAGFVELYVTKVSQIGTAFCPERRALVFCGYFLTFTYQLTTLQEFA